MSINISNSHEEKIALIKQYEKDVQELRKRQETATPETVHDSLFVINIATIETKISELKREIQGEQEKRPSDVYPTEDMFLIDSKKRTQEDRYYLNSMVNDDDSDY